MTIIDIAKEAGVAPSTVSRVVNNKPGIKAETRQKIQALLKKYNYTPDIAARGLVTQSTRMIGILIADIRVAHHTESAFLIEQELKKRGYFTMIMGTGQGEEDKAEYLRILGQRRVEGVILMGSVFMSDSIREAIQNYLPEIPVVMVNGYLDLPNVSGVIVDEDQGIEQCVELLLRKGKQRIAFVLDDPSPAGLKKEQGYRSGMKNAGFSDEDLIVYQLEGSTLEQGYRMTLRLLQEHPQVQGIIYTVDVIAAGGLRAAQDLGYRVPEDLSIIGVDNSIYSEICRPRLTTLDNRTEDMSMTAASILRDWLEGDTKGKKMMLFSKIIEREST